MIAVFQRNSIGAEDFLLFRHRLFKNGARIKIFPNQVLMEKNNIIHAMWKIKNMDLFYFFLSPGRQKGSGPVPTPSHATIIYWSYLSSGESPTKGEGDVTGCTSSATNSAFG